jgi:hypothetical protein
MSYLLLLALVLVAGFICIQLSLPASKRNPSQTFLLIALILVAAELVSEMVLGFTLDESAAKVFFWARGSLVMAWFGQSFLLALFPNSRWIRWLSMGILAVSLGLLVLVSLLQITAAVDWYSTAKPIYSQIGDLLATNRPARWVAIALNLYGVVVLLAGSAYILFPRPSRIDPLRIFVALLISLGAIILFASLYWPSVVYDFGFYVSELFAPIALFFGLKELASYNFELGRKQKAK